MPWNIHDGAAWRQARDLHIHDGSGWRRAREVYVHDGAAWRLAHIALRANLASRGVYANHNSLSTSPGMATAGFRLLGGGGAATYRIEGSIRSEVPIAGEWLVQGVPSQFEVMATLLSGTSPTGDSLGVWLPLSADREWRVFSSSTSPMGAVVASTLLIQIKAFGGVIVASAQITLNAFASRDNL